MSDDGGGRQAPMSPPPHDSKSGVRERPCQTSFDIPQNPDVLITIIETSLGPVPCGGIVVLLRLQGFLWTSTRDVGDLQVELRTCLMRLECAQMKCIRGLAGSSNTILAGRIDHLLLGVD